MQHFLKILWGDAFRNKKDLGLKSALPAGSWSGDVPKESIEQIHAFADE